MVESECRKGPIFLRDTQLCWRGYYWREWWANWNNLLPYRGAAYRRQMEERVFAHILCGGLKTAFMDSRCRCGSIVSLFSCNHSRAPIAKSLNDKPLSYSYLRTLQLTEHEIS